MTWKHYSLEQAASRFDNSRDFTVGIEEEFQILDAGTLELAERFPDLKQIAHPKLGPYVTGELFASEIEICTKKCDGLDQAEADLRKKRRLLAESAAELGVVIGAAGTHPFADWRDQHILETHHYREVEERTRYCAWRNLTYGMHVHVGLKGRERVIAVFDSMRGYLPALLALSANSPFAEGRFTYLHSTRSQIFTRSFPRCNIPEPFADWNSYASFIDMLFSTNSISEPTQVWWSLRPHPLLGTLEIRICDCQQEVRETTAIAALALALVATLARDYDEGRELDVIDANRLEENLWRATRYGLSGNLVDFGNDREVPATAYIEGLIERTGEAQGRLGLGKYIDDIRNILADGNGAQRQIRLYEETGDMDAVFADLVSGDFF